MNDQFEILISASICDYFLSPMYWNAIYKTEIIYLQKFAFSIIEC